MFVRKFAGYACALILGGAVYGAIETLWRGHTHPTMILVGGVCLAVMYFINVRFKPNIIAAAAAGCAVITSAELLSGCVINLWLGLDVWDYSALPFDLFGQICPEYSIYWAFLSVPAFLICRMISETVGDADHSASVASASENSSSSL